LRRGSREIALLDKSALFELHDRARRSGDQRQWQQV
jgi:hypothetical protein